MNDVVDFVRLAGPGVQPDEPVFDSAEDGSVQLTEAGGKFIGVRRTQADSTGGNALPRHRTATHLGETVSAIDGRRVTLSGGSVLDGDFVVIGAGVRPATALAERAGLATDRGITVNEFLETSVPGIYAAGDVARWPDPHTGHRIRVEHWVVAERQGQVAARNMLGQRVRFDAVPFFWSQHYDVTINYVGHAEQWDAIDRDGEIAAQDCTLSFRRGGRTLAVATIGRDLDSLRSELELEQATVPW